MKRQTVTRSLGSGVYDPVVRINFTVREDSIFLNSFLILMPSTVDEGAYTPPQEVYLSRAHIQELHDVLTQTKIIEQ